MHPRRGAIAFAADLPLEQGLERYRLVAPWVGVAKVGLSLFVEHGPAAVKAFQRESAQVFLDLKLHDIPNTVALAAAKAGALGVSFLTVHASGGAPMLQAALEGAARGAAQAGVPAPKILAVTVLTSTDGPTLRSTGVEVDARAQVERLALLAVKAGCSGLVCSAQEAKALRALLGPEVFLCTPGIRPVGASVGDQARVETPAAAFAAGSNLLVVGRPLSEAADPAAAARGLHEA